jgi:hypothetical protein
MWHFVREFSISEGRSVRSEFLIWRSGSIFEIEKQIVSINDVLNSSLLFQFNFFFSFRPAFERMAVTNPFEMGKRFVIQNGLVEKAIVLEGAFRDIVRVWIPCSILNLGQYCFKNCLRLCFVSFEFNSRLTQIPESTFCQSSIRSIVIPWNVEILSACCFQGCESLH